VFNASKYVINKYNNNNFLTKYVFQLAILMGLSKIVGNYVFVKMILKVDFLGKN